MTSTAPTQVTAIVVNHNGAGWLERCLSSLLSQTHVRLEVVLVDNASRDASVEHVRTFFPTVRIVQSPRNVGFAGGNQLGVAASTGTLVLLLNSDAWLAPDAVARLVAAQRSQRLDVVAPFEQPYEQTKRGPHGQRYVSTIDYLGHPFISGQAAWRERPAFYLSGVCLLFNKQLWDETGGLDPNFFMYCEEVDWFWRLLLQGRTFAYVDGVFVHHDGGSANGIAFRPDVFRWRNENTLQMLLKNYDASSLSWSLPAYLLQNIAEMLLFLALGRTQVAWTYPRGWIFNLRHLRRTLASRRGVQRRRVVSDKELRRRMYPGTAKLAHLASKVKRR